MQLSRLLVLLLAAMVPSAAGQSSHTLLGDSAGDNFGAAVAGAGDVNGDGFDDVVVGAPFDEAPGFFNNGSAAVYSGADGSLIRIHYGGADFDLFGRSVAGLGDLDQDGRSEIVVGAFFAPIVSASGQATVYSGLTGAQLMQFSGAAGDQLGQAVSAAGDADNDGVVDIALGAWASDAGGTDSGEVRIVSGLTGATLRTLAGAGANDFFGTSVGYAGDVDQDGFDDLVTGAYAADVNVADDGAAYVHSGKDGSLLWTFAGAATGDEFGIAVDGAGDVNQDGFPDLVVGAPGADGGGAEAGRATVWSGQDGSLLHGFDGAPGDRLGSSVARANDNDGDGFADVVLGAQFADANGAESGAAVVRSGKDGSVLKSYAGDAAGDELGRAVAGGFDVDADGIGDVAVAAHKNDQNGGDAGLVRVHFECLGQVITYGAGCPGTGGFVPSFTITGCPKPGGALTATISQGLGGSVAVILFGLTPGSTDLGFGCSLLVTPVFPFSLPIPLGGTGAGAGSVFVPFTVPPATPTLTATLQAYVVDPATPHGASLTNGVRIDVP